MSARIIGVNGIRSSGERNTDILLGVLERAGHEVFDFNYGRVGFFTARSRSRQKAIGHRLHELSREGDHVVAHSYGALVALRAMQAGARFGQVFLFAPAMNDDFTFPVHAARRIFVIHCPTDVAILGASLLMRHDFGGMGRTGYRGAPDPRVVNVPTGPQFLAHSAYFKKDEVAHWARFITARVTEAAPAAHAFYLATKPNGEKTP